MLFPASGNRLPAPISSSFWPYWATRERVMLEAFLVSHATVAFHPTMYFPNGSFPISRENTKLRQ